LAEIIVFPVPGFTVSLDCYFPRMISFKDLSVVLLLFISFVATGQGKIIDSLEHKLQTAAGIERVDVLNQLTFEFISVDNEKVVRYDDEAILLSEKIKYTKGEGIAYTFRGVYQYQSGQFAEARISLHTGLRLSKKAKDVMNEGYAYLQLGNASLEDVSMDSAYIYFRKAYSVFKDSSHAENLSKVYRNMSALFGQRFEPDSQQYYLDKAIVIRRLLPDQSYLVDALAIQANFKLGNGDLDAAEKLLDEAERILERYPNDLENLNDIRHVRAMVFFQKGEFEKAIVLFDSARNYYFRMSLFRKYVTLLGDLAKIFSDRGEYELALNNLYNALRLSRLKGFETETYLLRTRIGWINFNLGDYDQALRLANETLRSRPKRLLKSDLADALTLKGVVLTALKRLPEAHAILDTVLAMHASAGNKKGVSEGYMNLADVETQMNNLTSALALYEKSIVYADSSSYFYGLAFSNWGIADILCRRKEYSKINHYLNESEKFSRLIHSNEVLVLNYNTRRDILRAIGKFKEALQFSMMADQLKDSLRRRDLARRFVNLEKIQEIEQRDRNIKVLQQEKLLADDKINLQESKLQQQYILIIGGLFIIVLLIFFYVRIRNLNITITEKNNDIEAQAGKLLEVNQELSKLYKELSEQNEEIQVQAQVLSESNKSIVDVNRSLKQLVTEKTIALRKANEELIKHNNELLQFSYTVSHNLRGPVARLLGLTSLMATEKDLMQSQQWVNLIGKTSGELDLIIKDLSKILELRREPHHFRDHVNLLSEWKQSINLLHDNLTGDEQITADFHEIPELLTVRSMVQSAFYNLLSNALKFRSPDRLLRIHASSKIVGENAVVTVSDNGLGFDSNLYKDKLFRLYTRFHSHVEGRGLGLYLVKSQLEVVRGLISVHSIPGQGAKFEMTIPLVSELQVS
jgi:signal transduction histidine kinase